MKQLTPGRYIVISDIQAPYHDTAAVKALTRYIADAQPDGILCVGDEADCPEPSRWTRGTAREMAGTLEAGLLKTYRILEAFSDAIDGRPFHLMRSNHTDRIRNYLTKYAPAFSNTTWNDYPTIMGLTGSAPLLDGAARPLPITWHEQPYRFAPGWVMAHGDEGPSNRTAGGTALGLARRWGVSTLVGHTHKLGMQHDHKSMGGKITQHLTGVECGHLMDMRQAGYLRGGSANWQSGFATIDTTGRTAQVTPIPTQSRGFTVDGQRHTY